MIFNDDNKELDNSDNLETVDFSTGIDTMESLIEEFSPKQILERGEIVDGTILSVEKTGLVIDLGQKSEGFVPRGEMKTQPRSPSGARPGPSRSGGPRSADCR